MEAETITLYRAVSPSEYHQLSKSGQFQYLGGAEGKYFAEYEAHAREGGQVLLGRSTIKSCGLKYRNMLQISAIDFPYLMASVQHALLAWTSSKSTISRYETRSR
jgi:hypothetical protein